MRTKFGLQFRRDASPAPGTKNLDVREIGFTTINYFPGDKVVDSVGSSGMWP